MFELLYAAAMFAVVNCLSTYRQCMFLIKRQLCCLHEVRSTW